MTKNKSQILTFFTYRGSWILVKTGQFSKSYQTTQNLAKKDLNHSEDIIRTLFERIDDIKLKSNFEISYIPGVTNFSEI